MPNAFALKVNRETNELMMVRDANKKMNMNVYAAKMGGSTVPAGLAHTHPGKPVSFPDIDTREYGITQNYARQLKEDWHKYDHKWYGGLYRFGILFLIFVFCPGMYRLNQKIGYTLQKCTDDPERRFTDYGYETQSEWYTLADGRLITDENILKNREDLVIAIKNFIDSGLLMNCDSEKEFEEKWEEFEKFLSDDVFFSEGRPWRKADAIVSSKEFLKLRLQEWWNYNKVRKDLLSPDFYKAMNLIQYHPFDLTFEFPIHSLTPGIAMERPDFDGKHKWIWDVFKFVRTHQHNAIYPSWMKEYILGVNRGHGEYEFKHCDDQIHIETKNFQAWQDLDADFKNKGLVYEYFYGKDKTLLDDYIEMQKTYGDSVFDFEDADKLNKGLGNLSEKRVKWPQREESDLLRNERVWTIARPADGTTLMDHLLNFYKYNLQKAQMSSKTVEIAEITSRIMSLEQLSRDHYQINLDENGKIKEFLIYRNGYTPYHIFKRYSGLWSFTSADNVDKAIINFIHLLDCIKYKVMKPLAETLAYFNISDLSIQQMHLESIIESSPEFKKVQEPTKLVKAKKDIKGQRLKLDPDN